MNFNGCTNPLNPMILTWRMPIICVSVVEPLAVFTLAYLSYLTAELFHFSGIIRWDTHYLYISYVLFYLSFILIFSSLIVIPIYIIQRRRMVLMCIMYMSDKKQYNHTFYFPMVFHSSINVTKNGIMCLTRTPIPPLVWHYS